MLFCSFRFAINFSPRAETADRQETRHRCSQTSTRGARRAARQEAAGPVLRRTTHSARHHPDRACRPGFEASARRNSGVRRRFVEPLRRGGPATAQGGAIRKKTKRTGCWGKNPTGSMAPNASRSPRSQRCEFWRSRSIRETVAYERAASFVDNHHVPPNEIPAFPPRGLMPMLYALIALAGAGSAIQAQVSLSRYLGRNGASPGRCRRRRRLRARPARHGHDRRPVLPAGISVLAAHFHDSRWPHCVRERSGWTSACRFPQRR